MSVKTLRNIPATCDFNFTATWLAGRFPFFKSTVPEIFPPVCSSVGSCACANAVGAQTIKLMLRNKVGTNAALREHFLKSCNLHSISTCCALLSYSSGDLADGGNHSCGGDQPVPTFIFGLRMCSRLRRFEPFPWNLPSRAPTNVRLSAPRMSNRSLTQ